MPDEEDVMISVLEEILEDDSTGTVENVVESPVPFVNNEVETVTENKSGTIIHLGYPTDDYRQEIVQRAYNLGGIEFVKMIECESAFRPTAIGDQGNAYGLCQMNRKYHKLDQSYYDDWGTQLDVCYYKWTHHTKFYGYLTRKVNGVSCPVYVSDRFYIY